MKRKLVLGLAATAVVAAVSGVGVAVASASTADGICILNQNTWLRSSPGETVLLTLHAGRGFRVDIVQGTEAGPTWYHGHGAEAPAQPGWIPAGNCNF